MDVNAVLYAGFMAAARQLFDTTVRQQEADNDDVHNDDDDDNNVVENWDPDDDLVVGGSVSGNNDQEITASIRGEENSVDFNDEEGKGVENKINNLCNQDDTYDDAKLLVWVGAAGNNNQEIAAELEAESTKT